MLLLAAPSNVELVDQTFQIPADNWRVVDLNDYDLRRQFALLARDKGGARPALLLKAAFDVQAGPPVQLILMDHADKEQLNRGETPGKVAETQIGPRGRLEVYAEDDWAVVVENPPGRGESKVHLRVSIDFVEATLLPRQRQLTVLAIGFAVFFGIVTYSARRLWQTVKD
jgi:hypothetical protein